MNPKVILDVVNTPSNSFDIYQIITIFIAFIAIVISYIALKSQSKHARKERTAMYDQHLYQRQLDFYLMLEEYAEKHMMNLRKEIPEKVRNAEENAFFRLFYKNQFIFPLKALSPIKNKILKRISFPDPEGLTPNIMIEVVRDVRKLLRIDEFPFKKPEDLESNKEEES